MGSALLTVNTAVFTVLDQKYTSVRRYFVPLMSKYLLLCIKACSKTKI